MPQAGAKYAPDVDSVKHRQSKGITPIEYAEEFQGGLTRWRPNSNQFLVCLSLFNDFVLCTFGAAFVFVFGFGFLSTTVYAPERFVNLAHRICILQVPMRLIFFETHSRIDLC